MQSCVLCGRGAQERHLTRHGLCGAQSLGSGPRMPGFSSVLLSILVTLCARFHIYKMGIRMVPTSQDYCEDEFLVDMYKKFRVVAGI